MPQDRSCRARATVGRHLLGLSDAAARYDDLDNARQLGNVLLEDDRTVIATFGSKCECGSAWN